MNKKCRKHEPITKVTAQSDVVCKHCGRRGVYKTVDTRDGLKQKIVWEKAK